MGENPMKGSFVFFSTFFMELIELISHWLLRWNSLFFLDMMVNLNKILIWKWNSLKALLINSAKLRWRRLKMLWCGYMSKVGDCKASMSLIGWIPGYRIDIIISMFFYFKKWDWLRESCWLWGYQDFGQIFISIQMFQIHTKICENTLEAARVLEFLDEIGMSLNDLKYWFY